MVSKNIVLKCKSEKIINKVPVKIGNVNNNNIAVIKIEQIYKEEKVEVVKAPTKSQLSSKTKKEIDDLAKSEWGIKLDARMTKDKMVTQFVKEAKAIAKK